jgi:hypothetical protein
VVAVCSESRKVRSPLDMACLFRRKKPERSLRYFQEPQELLPSVRRVRAFPTLHGNRMNKMYQECNEVRPLEALDVPSRGGQTQPRTEYILGNALPPGSVVACGMPGAGAGDSVRARGVTLRGTPTKSVIGEDAFQRKAETATGKLPAP